MRVLVSCAQMKALDAHTISCMQVPSMVLMERAALAAAEEMERRPERLRRTLVVCGTGNNGGDGIAIARLLHLRGYAVDIYQPGNPSKYSAETKIQREIADNYGVPAVNNPAWCEYTTIVDAVFGVGLAREVEGVYAGIIGEINRTSADVWAVDIPSGVNGDTGKIMGHAVRAAHTVTFAFGKPGLYLYPGASCCGEVLVKDIGIYLRPEDTELYVRALEREDLRLLPGRRPDGNKGTFGKVLVAAGSRNMAGAAYLSGSAALLGGAGMVKIHTVEANRCILQQLLPEALLCSDEEEACRENWERNLSWADAVVLGPGIGTDGRALEMVRFYLENTDKPVVLDADALNLLSAHPELWKCSGENWILTPHPGELGRLMGLSAEEVVRELLDTAGRLSAGRGVICVAKDARTVIAMPDGRRYLNLTGNDGMATAGSGDVLSGILGSLLAQGVSPEMAAPLGVCLHGCAGDAAAKRTGRSSMTARDILRGIREVQKVKE